ncbi:MAG: hypothetical protein PHR92_18085 [Lachnospiraceae bacterium]|nr:hypothetical protein [Lachnospiraceae bacterium]
MSFMKIDGADIRAPSSFSWGKQDISGPNAGRTLDGVMHKNRIDMKRKLELAWNGLTAEQTKAVLQAFKPEYISVNYPDAMEGKNETRTFYTGDMVANMYSWTVNKKIYKQLSFSIVEQ